MTPSEFKQARQLLGLAQHEIAPLLGFGSPVRVSELETGRRNVSGAVKRLIRAYLDGYRPSDWPGRSSP